VVDVNIPTMARSWRSLHHFFYLGIFHLRPPVAVTVKNNDEPIKVVGPTEDDEVAGAGLLDLGRCGLELGHCFWVSSSCLHVGFLFSLLWLHRLGKKERKEVLSSLEEVSTMFLVVCCRRMTSSGEEFGGRVNNSVVVGLAKHVSHVHFGVDIFFHSFLFYFNWLWVSQ